jgi:predicted GIY-YIG superfamily endonuclease
VPTAVYRFFDAQDQLLYIGITSDPPTRWAAHAREKWWWSKVKRRETTWFPSRAIAHEAEVAAIRAEGPLHNGAHMAPGTKDLG